MRRYLLGVAAVCVMAGSEPALSEVLARKATPAGSIIARKVGEEARFIEISDWRTVELHQDLLAGDVLRTNALGQLAILFSDRTQVRIGRNTTLVVKNVGDASDTLLGLRSGTLWARAERGGEGLTIETPAASAAIRGTDWTMSVDADGRTSLVVLEGLVELSNEFGSVSVAEGEGAVASIGQAPSKVVIVDPDDREQMLFHLTLRGAFVWMPASPLRTPEMRREHERLTAVPEAARSAEDWVTLAETERSFGEPAVSRSAADRARALALTPQQKARLDLLDALRHGAEQRYAEAAGLFERAAPKLSGDRRAVALYGGYFARALAYPDRVERPPAIRDGGPYAALAEAWAAGFLRDIAAATDILREAERRFPDNPTLPAARAQLAMLLDDREQTKEAIDRALSIDPDDTTALEARANYRADIESNLDAALADLERAAEISPGSSTIWNTIGLVQSARRANREAEQAFLRSIELDPYDPVGYANLAIFYLDHDRTRDAKRLIDRAIEIDPSFDIALVARGRYHLQTGEIDAAIEDLLAGTTANPAYAQGLLVLAGGHYEAGDREPAEQALENADRLDPNDPVTSIVETAIAIDDYDSDRAIASAQEALRRARARGGDYSTLSANRDEGSLLNNAFRLQGLDAWGRFYGDAVFDPFEGAALVDQAVSGTSDPFVNQLRFGDDPVEPSPSDFGFSSLFQGLLMSPEMLSGRSRSANLFRRPFFEGAVGAGFTDTGDDTGWIGKAEIQGFSTTPVPWSIYAEFDARETDEFRERTEPGGDIPYVGFELGTEIVSGLGYATVRPTLDDRVVTYLNVSRPEDRLSNALTLLDPRVYGFDGILYDRSIGSEGIEGGVGWSHTFAYRNVMNAAYFASDVKQTSSEQIVSFVDFGGVPVPIGLRDYDVSARQRTHVGALSHSLGLGDLTLRYGVEGGTIGVSRTETLYENPPDEEMTLSQAYDVGFGRAYVDAVYEFGPNLKAEAALFGTWFGGLLDVERLEPRLGVAWAPVHGQWLRATYSRESEALTTTTLAPVAVLGLQPNAAPLDVGGYVDTFAARWDAEWSHRFFTSVDYQHQELYGLSIPVPGSLSPIGAGDGFEDGRIDRISATANLHLGHGFGLFGTAAWSDSENRTPGATFGSALPFVPELSGRAGITFVHPSNLKVTLSATYIGERVGDASGTLLDDYWTADAALTWEPLDKRFALELAGYNLFDEKFDVATSTPGWGRTFVGTFKVRF
ncbi:TonB-dependent receptor [Aquibium sp. LZ166]|uniref:TonB-dependent receptor n=1 Tax=Aquibium pacificus TaxID=3153579 RepID=A0ABV3SGU6_9HYPH